MISEVEVIIWFVLVAIGLLIAALGSGLETGVYSLNPVRLHVLEHTGHRSAQLLARHVAAPTAVLASLLIVHNAGVKLATHAAAVLLTTQGLPEFQVVAFDALIMMPLLFVFAETVPKDLFAVYADRLMYPFARLMVAFVYACRYSGLGPVLTGASGLFLRLLGGHQHAQMFHPRHHVQAMVKEGMGHGLLDDAQMGLVERIMDLGGQTVDDHMQPWKSVMLVHDNDPISTLWKLAGETSRTRFPVVDNGGDVLGILDITDVILHEPHNCPAVTQLMQPVQTLDAATPLRQGLNSLRTMPYHLAVITRREKPVGIITIKDLVEPITGELAAW